MIQPALFSDAQRRSRPIEARETPQIIKYMGSKARILDFVIEGLNRAYHGGGICDLFAGSCILSGAIGRSVRVFSNDIQSYSQALAGFYLNSWGTRQTFQKRGDAVLMEAASLARQRIAKLPTGLSYAGAASLTDFNRIEKRNRALISLDFDWKWHLFTKSYSGTWWSAEQCVWIDSFREVAEKYRDEPTYNLILVSLMHAMAYSGSGTGHYAQYRDAKTPSSMKDIAIYRNRDLASYFAKKYASLADWLPPSPPSYNHEITSLDYKERLATLPPCTVYADPPYAFVHYSRFYHAIETVYLYDFPTLQIKGGEVVKGRYREDRHQSPFCIRTQVPEAFCELFDGVRRSGSNLVLSYSKSGMISFEGLSELAHEMLKGYRVSVETSDHRHMTMGRRADRHREVEEVLIVAKRK